MDELSEIAAIHSYKQLPLFYQWSKILVNNRHQKY